MWLAIVSPLMTINLFLIKCCPSIRITTFNDDSDLCENGVRLRHLREEWSNYSPWTVNLACALSRLPTIFDAMHWYFPSSIVCTVLINKLPPSTIRSRLLLRLLMSSKSIKTPSCEGERKRYLKWGREIIKFNFFFLPFSTPLSVPDCLSVTRNKSREISCKFF